MPRTHTGSEFISLLTYSNVIYLLYVASIYGERIDVIDGAVVPHVALHTIQNQQIQRQLQLQITSPTPYVIDERDDEYISLDHIEQLCIEKCPDQVSKFVCFCIALVN